MSKGTTTNCTVHRGTHCTEGTHCIIRFLQKLDKKRKSKRNIKVRMGGGGGGGCNGCISFPKNARKIGVLMYQFSCWSNSEKVQQRELDSVLFLHCSCLVPKPAINKRC